MFVKSDQAINLADLFTKSLPRNIFEQLSHKIVIRHLKDVH
jgi:hypothetical protein